MFELRNKLSSLRPCGEKQESHPANQLPDDVVSESGQTSAKMDGVASIILVIQHWTAFADMVTDINTQIPGYHGN